MNRIIKKTTSAIIFLAFSTLWSAHAADTAGAPSSLTPVPPSSTTTTTTNTGVPIVIQLVQQPAAPAAAPAAAAETPATPATPSAPESSSSKKPAGSTSVAPAITGGMRIPEEKPPTGTKVAIPPTPSLDIIINKHHINSPRIKKLYAQLGVTGSPRVLHFVTNRLLADAHHSDNIFLIQPRSFIGILNYLALSVEVTEELLEKRIVQSPRYPDGSFFDFNKITEGILHVYMSDEYPGACANVSVFYRNHWYFIADNDWDSKRTFRAVQQMFNLQAGEISREGAPILTIPVR